MRAMLKIFLLIIILALAGFFCGQKSVVATMDASNVVISEIYGGGGNSGAVYKNDFIELYNPTSNPISLNGWSVQYAAKSGSFSKTETKMTNIFGYIPAYGFYLIQEETGVGGTINISNPDAPGKINLSAAVGKIALVKSAEVITSKDDANVVDFVGYGKDVSEYEGIAPVSSISNNTKSIARIFNNGIIQDTDNNFNDFETQTCPSPKAQSATCQTESGSQTITPPADENPITPTPPADVSVSSPSSTSATSTSQKNLSYQYGDVVINEFVPDPADEQVEFVELYNKRLGNVSILGWTLTDGSGAQTILNGVIAGSGAEKYFVIEKPKGNLNNAGDLITLKWGETIIDQVAYGNWKDGNTDDNAPTAGDPKSVARKGDGFNTYNNKNDFAVTATITKGGANIITDVDNSDIETRHASSLQNDYSEDIIISEIFPNPKGSDNEAEFIELFNKGEKAVNLEGWILSDSTIKNYKLRINNLKNIIIKPQDYFVVYRKDSGIALNNTDDKVKLYQPLKDEALQVVKYEKAKENWSYSLVNATSTKLEYKWTEIVTPGARNIIKTINHPPLADFSFFGEQVVGQIMSFDSSDTVDEDGDKLSYSWGFGNGNLNSSSTEPNPIFIYFTPGMKQVKLIVSDGENKVNVEKMVEINPKAYPSLSLPLVRGGESGVGLVIISEFMPNPEGPDESEWIELKNIGSSTVNLINWQLDDAEGGSSPYVIKKDTFINPLESKIFEREETKIVLNNTVDSVRLFNSLGELVDEYSYSKTKEGVSFKRQGNSWLTAENITSAVSASGGSKTTTSAGSKKYQPITETTLEKIREFESGDKIKVAGTVAVLPGVFSTQYFYIVGSPGVQVYSSKKLFPDLQIGDQVEISGELSKIYGELRLKISTAEDIKKIATSTPPEPVMTECDKIGENMEAQLVRIKGEVVDKHGSIIWLDDGSSEIEVYIKTGVKINKANINEGDNITVIGIVSQKNDSYRVMPRSQDDIIFEGVNRTGEVLGEISVSDSWQLAQNNKKMKLIEYLLVLAGGLIVVLGGVIWKGKGG